MNRLLMSTLLITLVFTSCAKKAYYLNSDFNKISANHQTIAIVPVEMILTGQMPEGMDDSDIEALEEAESKAFQKSLYNQIHWSPPKSKHSLVVFQSVEKTNEILGQHEISVRRTWKMTAEELAELLEVDAVVRLQVEKQRYMSDIASMGISIGKRIIDILTRFRSLAVTNEISKTSDINANCSIVNGKDGSVLWSMKETASTDWQRPSFEVIDKLNRDLAKDMPYRAK
ncbi:MAG: hypothetical protein R3E32_27220 [Chitinophagales bacterium]